MALKFLNKKGWHTGSLRNIENVWKAEQKHEAEEKKLDELRKQIHEERERNEFRLLQVKAGLVPAQERLDFLYDSGLSVGRSTDNEGFKALEAFPKSDGTDAPSSSSASVPKEQPGASVPGALFEDKPQSANDAWRKLHSDPLLMIRQREQEALAKIKNNPIKMAMIKKSVEETKHKEKSRSKKEKRKKHHSSKSKHKKQSDSEDDIDERRKRKTDDRSRHKKQSDSEDEDDSAERRKRKTVDRSFDKKYHKAQSDSEYESSGGEKIRRKNHYEDKKYRERSPSHHQRHRNVKDYNEDADDRNYKKSKSERYDSGGRSNIEAPKMGNGSFPESSSNRPATSPERGQHYKRRNAAPKLSEEERAAKLRQMQLAAELHEEQRWKRIKKAEETDAQEAIQNTSSGGRNFLDAAQKSVYGAAEGGSSSIAESVRRRTHYSQGRSAGEGNAFRRD
ncbi:PREDICTED: pre-mRNA-splicing factor CWC25 homolog isoform X2 [Lupinus angustifolius]|uniref:pre-mRNA-splicing factor CWC25 homolog isoform X2 n=1 Tax=Lupinus angustifolius TaxID=3871 RepID=UPI00092F78A1|nr:PREDICTED: pre-mRNA-splicing factor CWC25 homolog isoform X2 [Lupinus angustifolius]